MTQINKFAGYGIAVAAALVAAIALLAGTAYADVEDITASPTVIEPGATSEVTADLGATLGGDATFDDTVVTFRILGGSSADGEWDANGEQVLECTISVDGSGDITAADCEGTAGVVTDETVTVDLVADGNSPEGQLNLLVSHDGQGTTHTVFVVGDEVSEGEDIAISAPSTIDEDGEVNITVTALDDDGDRVAMALDVVVSSDAELSTDGGTDCVRLADEADTAGTCDITTTASGTAAGVGLRATGDPGDVIEVTAFGTGPNGVPVVAVAEITIADEAATVTVEAEASVAAGSVSAVTVTVLDADGNPVGDGTPVNVDASAGIITCPGADETDAGMLECNFVAPGSAQIVVISAEANDVIGTTNVSVGGAAQPGAGSFTGSIPSSGVALVTFDGGTVASLAAAAQAAGALSVSATVGGEFIVYIVGAPAFVNAAFNAAFPTGLEAGTPVILFVPAS